MDLLLPPPCHQRTLTDGLDTRSNVPLFHIGTVVGPPNFSSLAVVLVMITTYPDPRRRERKVQD